jgi:AcrR family transcriptional regulator
VAAIVQAAVKLFAANGPDGVSLRQVAATAGVNYGLIHQYVGSKDDLLHLVFRSVSEHAADDFADATNVDEVLERLMSDAAAATPYVRMLAWAILQGRDASDLLGRSPALAVLIDRIDGDGQDPRLVVAAVTSMVLGWRLFGPFVRSGAGLGRDTDPSVDTDPSMDTAIRGIAGGLLSQEAHR